MSLFDAIKEQEGVNGYDLESLVRQANPTGLFLEFGVSGGSTLHSIARNTTVPVYGFDWWEGIPEDLCGITQNGKTFVHDAKGSFKGKPERIPPNCTLINGLFEDSLPDFIINHPEEVSFMHIDCDLYSSTKTVLNAFRYSFMENAIIAFDEFAEYSADVWMYHEFLAFEEFIEENPQWWIQCIAYTRPRAAFKIWRRV